MLGYMCIGAPKLRCSILVLLYNYMLLQYILFSLFLFFPSFIFSVFLFPFFAAPSECRPGRISSLPPSVRHCLVGHGCTVAERGGDMGSPVVYLEGNRPWFPLSTKIVLDIGKIGKQGLASTLCESISGQRQFSHPLHGLLNTLLGKSNCEIL